MDSEQIALYSSRLVKEPFEDVVYALEKLAELPKGDYEPAMLDIGSVLALVSTCTVARRNRDRIHEYYQQQQCPKCRGVVGMMRPVGEQFRTWCGACQTYRKIVPEDLALNDREWRKLCAELEIIHADWVARGSKYNECIDPQFDRRLVMEESCQENRAI